MKSNQPDSTGFRTVPKTGVIFVMSEAGKAGYKAGDPTWTNFGQGQPEAGMLPGGANRLGTIEIDIEDHEYAPVAGVWELREAVADHYNRTYRRGMKSQYSAENVCLSSGGRAALTRIAASLDGINLGHFLPDYTAYEELLSLFRRFTPIPILLDPETNYAFSADDLRTEILGRGLSAILFSNPCNPTGKTVGGAELSNWVEVARDSECTLVIDEFYSHYTWNVPLQEASAAAYVEDVDEDPVVLVNGLTKNFRYPGWRVAWTLAPTPIIERLSSAGSFLDGGGSRPLQRAAIPLLQTEIVEAEAAAIRNTFEQKRDLVLSRLKALGFRVENPEGTFYIWADVSELPEQISDGMKFFRAGLQHQFICVPGQFFDVNPGHRRSNRRSRFGNYVRFSFGPPIELLAAGLDRIEQLVAESS